LRLRGQGGLTLFPIPRGGALGWGRSTRQATPILLPLRGGGTPFPLPGGGRVRVGGDQRHQSPPPFPSPFQGEGKLVSVARTYADASWVAPARTGKPTRAVRGNGYPTVPDLGGKIQEGMAGSRYRGRLHPRPSAEGGRLSRVLFGVCPALSWRGQRTFSASPPTKESCPIQPGRLGEQSTRNPWADAINPAQGLRSRVDASSSRGWGSPAGGRGSAPSGVVRSVFACPPAQPLLPG
jgi:hypothetical protein